MDQLGRTIGEAYIHKINQSKTINLTLTMNVTVRVRFMVWDWFILWIYTTPSAWVPIKSIDPTILHWREDGRFQMPNILYNSSKLPNLCRCSVAAIDHIYLTLNKQWINICSKIYIRLNRWSYRLNMHIR